MELESGEIVWGESTVPDRDPDTDVGLSTSPAAVLAGMTVAVGLLLGAGFAFSGTEPQPADEQASSLGVADAHRINPSASTARDLFASVGGLDALTIGTAVGAFDLVRFDPSDPDRLLATHRSSYGTAQNQSRNELWNVAADGTVDQGLWAPTTNHDFVHFNVDGTKTMWVHGGGDGFAPRVAVQAGVTTEPIHASRFAAAGETVFALTGDGEYYSQRTDFVDLVADRGSGPIVLDDGAKYSWIDTLSPNILVAYPTDENGLTAVWDVNTLAPVPDHLLASRRVQRLTVSADGSTAAALTFAGDIQVIDARTGRNLGLPGRMDGVGVDQPLTLSSTGDVLVTVEADGMVTLWWTRDVGEPFAQFEGVAAQPRWLSDRYAATSASAVAADASRIALRTAATADARTTWIIVDTDLESWMDRANAQD